MLLFALCLAALCQPVIVLLLAWIGFQLREQAEEPSAAEQVVERTYH